MNGSVSALHPMGGLFSFIAMTSVRISYSQRKPAITGFWNPGLSRLWPSTRALANPLIVSACYAVPSEDNKYITRRPPRMVRMSGA